MSLDHFKNMTIQQMAAIVSLAEEGSFSRAAQKMFLSQPALTKNIKNMENSLGVTLVNRSKSGITLTADGRFIYNYARKMIKLRNEAAEKIAQIQGTMSSDIAIGASTIPATYLLPPLLSAFRKQNASVRVHVQSADSEEIIHMVLAGEVEIGFVGKSPSNKKILAEPLWKDRLVLVVPRHHPWCRKKTVTVKEVAREPFVIRERGSATREVLEVYLKEYQATSLARFNICGELGSSEAIKEAVLAGLGVSILSRHAVCRELQRGLLQEIILAGCNVERYFYLIRQRQAEIKPPYQEFLDFMKDYSLEGRFL